MPDFSIRATTPELMDTEACSFETFRDCLVDLAAVNRLTLAYRPTLGFFERLRREGCLPAGRPLRVLDVGSGYGDMLRRVAAWAESRSVEVELTGVDLNPWSARAAAAARPADPNITWVTADAFGHDQPVDVVISSLFAHHLDDTTLVRFIAWMEARAQVGWFVNDLRRAAFSYYGFGLLARLMRWHRFVQHDGPVSIARAFRGEDWRRLVNAAGLPSDAVRIEPRFPYRLCVARVRT